MIARLTRGAVILWKAQKHTSSMSSVGAELFRSCCLCTGPPTPFAYSRCGRARKGTASCVAVSRCSLRAAPARLPNGVREGRLARRTAGGQSAPVHGRLSGRDEEADKTALVALPILPCCAVKSRVSGLLPLLVALDKQHRSGADAMRHCSYAV